ncbi:36440_t:CDS:2 [Gigaspora margarita]|uniref:36440_t:CDS:1 n=1 Tax=Gigaspora margarita TaxID=4874 RepID=A0ABN7VQP7_GIGMA|nr:36440_t:CDS:2 [Gigaspora margarita]
MSFHSVSDETKNAFCEFLMQEQQQLKYKNDEEMLANRAVFPYKSDIKYLHKKYHEKHIGVPNGKEMFNWLEKEISDFNTNKKGNTLIQDTPAGGLPLAAIHTSNEIACTFTKVLAVFKQIIPSTAFGGRGPIVGLQVIMTDNCKAEKIALHNTWKNATLLLHVFYFLQTIWRWLWDSKHGINNKDHYLVDMRVGTCEYNLMGAPCMHQVSIAKHFNVCGLNQIPTISVEKCLYYTYLALGKKCKPLNFYTHLHQKQVEEQHTNLLKENRLKINSMLINEDYSNNNKLSIENASFYSFSSLASLEYTISMIMVMMLVAKMLCWFCSDLEDPLRQNDPELNNSVHKEGLGYGLKKVQQGRSKKDIINNEVQKSDNFIMPERKKCSKNVNIT